MLVNLSNLTEHRGLDIGKVNWIIVDQPICNLIFDN